MFLPGRCSVGTVGSSTSFLFSIRCKNSYKLGYRLWPIVGCNRLRYSKHAPNVLPYKLNNLFIFDGCEGFGFYLFAEIVCGNQ